MWWQDPQSLHDPSKPQSVLAAWLASPFQAALQLTTTRRLAFQQRHCGGSSLCNWQAPRCPTWLLTTQINGGDFKLHGWTPVLLAKYGGFVPVILGLKQEKQVQSQQNLVSKPNTACWAVVQLIECLCNMLKAPGPIPSSIHTWLGTVHAGNLSTQEVEAEGCWCRARSATLTQLTHTRASTQNLAFIRPFTNLLLRQHRWAGPQPPIQLPQPLLPPTPPLALWWPHLYLTPGMQHEVAMQLPEVVKGVLTLRTVVGAPLLLIFIPIPPCWLIFPSARRFLLFLPKSPALRSWGFLGCCCRAAESARRGTRWGFSQC